MTEPENVQVAARVRLDITGMRTPNSHGSFVEFVRRLWSARTLSFLEARSKALDRNKRNKLGSLWLILLPVFNGIIYYTIFGIVLKVGDGLSNYIGFLIIGVFMFQMTTGALTTSSDSIFAGRKQMRASSLPLAMSPIILNIERWLAGFPSYLVMILMILLLPPVENLSWIALLIIPVVLLQAVFTLGLSMVVAHFVAKIYDLKILVSLFIRGWMFGSGVMFSVEKIAEAHPAFGPFIDLNPMHHILTATREVLLYDTVPPALSWIVIGAWAIFSIVLGIWLLWRNEGRYHFSDD